MDAFFVNSVSVQAILALSLGWIAYTTLLYIRTRRTLSSYPIYHAEGDNLSPKAIPILELHSSAKILSDGFTKFGVSIQHRSIFDRKRQEKNVKTDRQIRTRQYGESIPASARFLFYLQHTPMTSGAAKGSTRLGTRNG